MKPQTLPTSIEYGKMLTEKVDQEVINHLQYFIYRREFDAKIMQPPTIADFIPAVYESGGWSVLDKPRKDDCSFYTHINLSIQEEYQTALNNVKFSGWSVKYQNDAFIGIESNGYGLEFDVKTSKLSNGINYSDLTTLNLPLTERGMEDFNINI